MSKLVSRRMIFAIFLTFFLHLLVAFPPLAILAFIASIVLTSTGGLITSFVLGLFADLIYGNWIGLSVFVYLGIAVFTLLYRRKISPTNPGFLISMAFISATIEHLVLLRSWNLWVILLTPVAVFTILLIVGIPATDELTKS